MQKKIFAILLVTAMAVLAGPGVQAKALFQAITTSKYYTCGRLVGQESVNNVFLGSATNEINYTIDFKFPDALGSTYGRTPTGKGPGFCQTKSSVLLHAGLLSSRGMYRPSTSGVYYTNVAQDDKQGTIMRITQANQFDAGWAGLPNYTGPIYASTGTVANTTITNNPNIMIYNCNRYSYDSDTQVVGEDMAVTGLAAVWGFDNKPYYSVESQTDPDKATKYYFRLSVYRPIPIFNTSTARRYLANGTGGMTYDAFVTSMGINYPLSPVVASDTEMTSRILPLASNGAAAVDPTITATHKAFTDNFAGVPYDHQWHTLRITIASSGNPLAGPSATSKDLFGYVVTNSGYYASLEVNNVMTGGGGYSGEDFVTLSSGTLTLPEYKAMNSYAAAEDAAKIVSYVGQDGLSWSGGSVGSGTVHPRYFTGRSWFLRTSWNDSLSVIDNSATNYNTYTGAPRYDNININGTTLEYFNMSYAAYYYSTSSAATAQSTYPPNGKQKWFMDGKFHGSAYNGAANSAQGQYNYIDASENSIFEIPLAAHDWTIY